MAVKTLLVLGADGTPEQLQPGDSVVNVSGSNTITRVATPALVKGQAVYVSSAGAVSKAIATARATSYVLGLAQAAATAGASVSILMNEVMTMTTAEWDAVTGGTGGLVANQVYFLSPTTAGNLTATCPSASGQTATRIGIALSTTEMNVEPGIPILL